MSFSGTMNISTYTHSEQPIVAGKYLTKLPKNRITAVAYIANFLRGPPKSLVESVTAAAVAR